MVTHDRIGEETTLVLGDRVFGALDPQSEPAEHHLGGWIQASRQWILFKVDHTLGTQATLGVARSTEELARSGFSKASAPPDLRTPVYILILDGSEERAIEVTPGTDPTCYVPATGLPGLGNGPDPGGC